MHFADFLLDLAPLPCSPPLTGPRHSPARVGPRCQWRSGSRRPSDSRQSNSSRRSSGSRWFSSSCWFSGSSSGSRWFSDSRWFCGSRWLRRIRWFSDPRWPSDSRWLTPARVSQAQRLLVAISVRLLSNCPVSGSSYQLISKLLPLPGCASCL